MRLFTKLRHYYTPYPASSGSPVHAPSEHATPSHQPSPAVASSSSASNKHVLMWVSTSPTQPKSPCASALRHFYLIAQPTLRTLGQCMFGLAMLFIIAGIALCIWGYVGTAIRPFQIFGPVCIGIGFLIYIIGCILCCREYPAFEEKLQEKARQEKARRAITLLGEQEVVEWIQGEPEVYEEFREVATKVLYHHGLFANQSNNVITNLYVNNLCQEV